MFEILSHVITLIFYLICYFLWFYFWLPLFVWVGRWVANKFTTLFTFWRFRRRWRWRWWLWRVPLDIISIIASILTSELCSACTATGPLLDIAPWKSLIEPINFPPHYIKTIIIYLWPSFYKLSRKDIQRTIWL